MEQNPYIPPSSQASGPGYQTIRGPYGDFRQNGPLRGLIVLLLATKALLFVFVYVTVNFIVPRYDGGNLSNLFELLGTVRFIQISVTLLAIIFFCIWVNRSCKNGWLLDGPKMKTTPGFSVGYYFIPVIAWWKPFTSMREIARASFGRDDALKKILTIWWTLWIVIWAMMLIIFMMNAFSPDRYTVDSAKKLHLVLSPVHPILDLLVIYLVTSITSAQNRRAASWRP